MASLPLPPSPPPPLGRAGQASISPNGQYLASTASGPLLLWSVDDHARPCSMLHATAPHARPLHAQREAEGKEPPPSRELGAADAPANPTSLDAVAGRVLACRVLFLG